MGYPLFKGNKYTVSKCIFSQKLTKVTACKGRDRKKAIIDFSIRAFIVFGYLLSSNRGYLYRYYYINCISHTVPRKRENANHK